MEITQEFLTKELDKRFKEQFKLTTAYIDRAVTNINGRTTEKFMKQEFRFNSKLMALKGELQKFITEELRAQSKELKDGYEDFVVDAIDTHELWVAEHFKVWFNDSIVPYDVRLRVNRLETQMEGLVEKL